MVSVGEDNIARVWDVSTGKEIMHKPHDNYTVKATLSPNGKYLLTEAFADGNITHVWNVFTGSEIFHNEYNLRDLGDNNVENYLIATAFSPDSQYIALGSSHGIINIFEITSGKEVGVVHQTREVMTLAFSPDGKYIVSGGFGGTARVWDISLGQEIFSKSYDGSVDSVGFSPDGNHIFSLGCSDLDNDGHCQEVSAQIWKWRPSDLIDDSCIRVPRNLTRAEWTQYLGDALAYQAVCPKLPIEAEATTTPTATP
jgi:WD40 repeat protein